MTAPPRLRICAECTEKFLPVRHDQRLCLLSCRRAFHNREAKRGAEAYRFLVAWRRSRGKIGLSEVSAKVDGWLREDADTARKVKAAKLAESGAAKARADRGGADAATDGSGFRETAEVAA